MLPFIFWPVYVWFYFMGHTYSLVVLTMNHLHDSWYPMYCSYSIFLIWSRFTKICSDLFTFVLIWYTQKSLTQNTNFRLTNSQMKLCTQFCFVILSSTKWKLRHGLHLNSMHNKTLALDCSLEVVVLRCVDRFLSTETIYQSQN